MPGCLAGLEHSRDVITERLRKEEMTTENRKAWTEQLT